MVQLFGNERIDYIGKDKLKIIQSPSVFTFSLDAVLLANFVYVPIQKGTLLDLCTGTGAIPLILSRRTKGNIIGVEIQATLVSMAERSIKLNQLRDQIQIEHRNILELETHHQYDVVTCNPPYFSSENPTDYNESPYLAIARHEIYCSLEDVIRIASRMLRNGGKAAFVHRPERLVDLMAMMRKYHLEPKRLQFVYPKQGREANMILIEGTLGGKPELHILPPLITHDMQNRLSGEVLNYYEC